MDILVRVVALAYTFAVAREIYLRLSAAALFVSLITPSLSHATSQECDGTLQRPKDTTRAIKVVIASVEFQDRDGLREEIHAQIKRDIKQEFSVGPGTPDMDWVAELEVRTTARRHRRHAIAVGAIFELTLLRREARVSGW
jgi:hypothetical protein